MGGASSSVRVMDVSDEHETSDLLRTAKMNFVFPTQCSDLPSVRRRTSQTCKNTKLLSFIRIFEYEPEENCCKPLCSKNE